MTNSWPQRFGVKKMCFVVLAGAALWAAPAVTAQAAEKIDSFSVEARIQPDGTMLVTEKIDYDFGLDYKHGIYRDLAKQHPQKASVFYKKRYVDYEVLGVTRDGVSEKYTVKNGFSGKIRIKIGQPDKTITGEHEYLIKYKIIGAPSVSPNLTEIYWNVTGDEWPVEIDNITVRLIAGEGVKFTPEQACYVGKTGSVASCDKKIRIGDNESFFTQAKILPGQGLTVAQAIVLPQAPVVLEDYNNFIIWVVTLLVWTFVLGIYIYHWRTKYKIDKPVVAQYEPYPGLKPMFTGVLIDGKLDTRDIAAGIIYLAQQGFISIKQIQTKVLGIFDSVDYEVTLLRPGSETETSFQRRLLSLIFKNLNIVGKTVKLSDLKKSLDKKNENYKEILRLKTDTESDLKDKGFIEKQSVSNVLVWGLFIILLAAFWFGVMLFGSFLIFGLSVAIIISVILILSLTRVRKTRRGYEAVNHIKGFKEFLSVTDKERFKFHNAPDKNPEKFMEYLPYAIALGVEEEWAKAFADIPMSNPDWYKSDNNTDFNPGLFARNINSFTAAFAGVASVKSNGFGSSGGGSSGGGFGGGGGGSW